jgi:glyoxylase-like metal-dependent hydrolase (beta-lactamase superfamily II)
VNRTLQDRQVAENVFVFEGTYVNWAIIADGTDLTLVDTGWHGDIQLLERSIRLLGRRAKDVRAVLLTHAHADHVGALNHLHDSYGIPLYMDPLEVPHARGEKVETATPIDVIKRLHRPQVVRWAVSITKVGALDHFKCPAAEPFPAAGPLDLPGRPIPIPTHGHTSGHIGYYLAEAGVLLSGDALITRHPTVSGTGPALVPADFSHSQPDAIRALEAYRRLDADMFVPGHGPVWYGPVCDAVDRALEQLKRPQ